MNSRDIKMLDNEGFFWYWYDDDDRWEDYYHEMNFYEDYSINYDIDENGLINWTEEIPVNKLREYKIDQILYGKDISSINKSVLHKMNIYSFFKIKKIQN